MRLAIYGTGGSGSELYERIIMVPELKSCWNEIIFIDDTKESGLFLECSMVPFDDFLQQYSTNDTEIAIALGEPKYRKILYDKIKQYGYKLATIIDPTAKVALSASIGEGVIVKDDVIISSNAVIKDNVYINGSSMIGHDVTVGEHTQISSYSATAGHTTIGTGCYIGLSSAIRENLTIGDNSIVSMGAIVMKDVPANMIVMGNPARVIAKNEDGLVF